MPAPGWYALSGPRIGVMLTTTGPPRGAAASGFGDLEEPRSPRTPGFARPEADVAKNVRATPVAATTKATKTRTLKNPPSPRLLRKCSRAGGRAGADEGVDFLFISRIAARRGAVIVVERPEMRQHYFYFYLFICL